MSDKPTVLDWHKAAAEELSDILNWEWGSNVKNMAAESIAAHDPANAKESPLVTCLGHGHRINADQVCTRCGADFRVPKHDDLQAEVARLRKALEDIGKTTECLSDGCDIRCCMVCGEHEDICDCLGSIARRALEGK